MKKTLKLTALLLVALFGLTAWSCSDDDDKIVDSTELPTAATTFLNTYYPDIKIVQVNRDKDHGKVEYDVMLLNGHEVTFNESGDWTDVDAPDFMSIPTGFIPNAIVTYVNSNYPNTGINEISKENYGYNVELVNTVDLRFDLDGGFIGYDR